MAVVVGIPLIACTPFGKALSKYGKRAPLFPPDRFVLFAERGALKGAIIPFTKRCLSTRGIERIRGRSRNLAGIAVHLPPRSWVV